MFNKLVDKIYDWCQTRAKKKEFQKKALKITKPITPSPLPKPEPKLEPKPVVRVNPYKKYKQSILFDNDEDQIAYTFFRDELKKGGGLRGIQYLQTFIKHKDLYVELKSLTNKRANELAMLAAKDYVDLLIDPYNSIAKFK